jgi:hypothetical protein
MCWYSIFEEEKKVNGRHLEMQTLFYGPHYIFKACRIFLSLPPLPLQEAGIPKVCSQELRYRTDTKFLSFLVS